MSARSEAARDEGPKGRRASSGGLYGTAIGLDWAHRSNGGRIWLG
ncbi:MAG: hypothetical protein AAF280_00240 [Pseudomonadota bacterium]